MMRPIRKSAGWRRWGRILGFRLIWPLLLFACTHSETGDRVVEPLGSSRIKKPPSPWITGIGKSTFAEIGLLGDYFFHNPLTGGVISIRALPLSFRYRDFKLPDHARRIYRRLLEARGNNMRTVKENRFLPLESAWSIQSGNDLRRLEFQLKGSVARPVIDEEAKEKRMEEELLSADRKEEKFGPETKDQRAERLKRDQSQGKRTRGARGKIVLLMSKGKHANLLYEFALLDHELTYPGTVKAFDQMVSDFEMIR